MPILSMFYGIIIRMYFFDDKQHHLPHLHAEYAANRAVFSIEPMNYPAASCGVSARRDKNFPEGVTPKCINRGASPGLAWIPA